MGGISSSIGLVSGIDTFGIIEQLLAVERRPRDQIALRITSLRQQQTALLDINSRLLTLNTTASSFRTDDIFDSTQGTTSDEETIGVTTTSDAVPGSYQFIVKQLVSNSQQLSSGFASRDATPLGLDEISFEFGAGRISSEIDLEDLAGGAGIDRGTIEITDRAGNSATVDLTDVVTASEVVERINDTSGIFVEATISGDGFVLNDTSGGSGNFIVLDGEGDTTATDLGLATVAAGVASSTITGTTNLYRLGASTPLSQLNDGRGVLIRENVADFTITASDGTQFDVDLGRVDNAITTDTLLEDLNNGAGVPIDNDTETADISITDRSGNVYEIDLTGSTTVGNIAARIDTASGGRISLTVDGTGDRFVITDTAPGGDTGNLIVDGIDNDDDVAEALGILNADGAAADSFTGEVIPSTIDQARASTIQDVINRINNAVDTTDGANAGRIVASIDASGRGLRIQDTTGGGLNFEITTTGSNPFAASDLGIEQSVGPGSDIDGQRIIGGLDSVLLSSLNGGSGLSLGGLLNVTARDGSTAVVDLDGALGSPSTVSEVINAINFELDTAFLGEKVRLELNESGNGFQLRDVTGGSGVLAAYDSGGGGAAALGIDTGVDGVLSDRVVGTNQQAAYVSESTRLDDLGPSGVGTGSFTIVDGLGAEATVNIGGDEQSLFDVIAEINSRGLAINARVNDNGDGLIIEEDLSGFPASTPFQAISIEDVGGGTVARNLNIAGSAPDISEAIDGSFQLTVDLDTSDTLDEVVAKINAAGFDVSANVINTGAGATPFRLNLSSGVSGARGELVIDTGGVDLGLTATSRGRDARVFFGSDDPSDALLVTSRTNQVTDVIDGVTLDLKKVSDTAVTINVSKDIAAVADAASGFVTAINDVFARLDQYDFFDTETEERGVLLGDPTVANIRNSMFRIVNQRAVNVSGTFQFLTQVGIRVGGDSQLTFDRERFLEALEADPEGVEALFTSREVRAATSEEIAPGITIQNNDLEFSSLGFGPLFENLMDDLTNSQNGIVTQADNAIDSQISLLEGRIEDLDGRLETRREALQLEFANLELLLSDLQQQGSAIAGLGGAV